jgi:hypothetical protein
MAIADRRLDAAVAAVAAGAGSVEELHEVFLDAIVYCERGERPGFRALGPPGAGTVPVYSSPEQLGLARGAVDWFAMQGRDLLTELPEGYDVLLDMAGPRPLRLSHRALRQRVVIEVRTGGGRA